jgi:hypothetical protein
MASPTARVLGLLRLIKATKPWDQSAFAYVRAWTKEQSAYGTMARIFAFVQDEAAAADLEIRALGLPPEEIEGASEVINDLREAFDISNANKGIQAYLPQIDVAITLLAVLVRAQGLAAPERPPAAKALLAEINRTLASLDRADLDPRITETARVHLAVLMVQLDNFEAFGVDVALVAYANLVVRLKRAIRAARSGDPSDARTLFATVLGWGRLLRRIDEVCEGDPPGRGTNVAALLRA